MNPNESENDDFSQEDARKFAAGGLRQYGVYSAVVFQMLATIGLAFWGGKKLNDYWEIKSNLLTLAIGLAGMALAFYSLLRQLKNIQKNENQK
ncbi:AtpZ/AtpI family protein [Weeksellaceae bacterium A-14]|uniref:AtpZ/AtpI family protein n=1 Tax=Daejeonia sp. YH14 TaxID=3439042 RepID=UPI0031E4CF5A